MTIHTVEQGEYLSGIARAYGFTSHAPIWDHPSNAALRKRRGNPNVVFPGDEIFIPEPRPKHVARATGALHRFELHGETVLLRLVIGDRFSKPIANAPCELRVEDEPFALTTDGAGKLEQKIRPGAREALLVVKDAASPIDRVAIPVRIGHLDPVDTPSGQAARLDNLGYFAALSDDEGADEKEREARFLSAVEEFQCDQGLVVDGKCGPVTQARLKKVHGC